jgi:iron(III) transport system ATP-binding protein
MSSAIEITGVAKRFGPVEALRESDLRIEAGELFGVLGPSGCGKSTLLRLVMGFERPDAGTIKVGDRVLAGDGQWVPPERRRVGMVVQDYALFPHLDVRRNVEFGLHRTAKSERGAIAQRALELVGLQHKSGSYPHQLSGGERQRVALARALAPEPEVVLLDEPFSSLDASLRAELRREVELILRDVGATAVLVTHDQEEALSLSDRLAVMREGRIVQVGSPRDIYWRPAERWVAGFVGEVNVLHGVARGRAVATDYGTFDLMFCEPAQGPVNIAVRPEQFDLAPDLQGNAEVVEREFYGHDVMYRVHHQNGRNLLVQSPSTALLDIGSRVMLTPNATAVASLVD